MSFMSCEFCSKASVFTVRQEDLGLVRERHVCVIHARELDLPVGTYVYGDKKYPSFEHMAAELAGDGHFSASA